MNRCNEREWRQTRRSGLQLVRCTRYAGHTGAHVHKTKVFGEVAATTVFEAEQEALVCGKVWQPDGKGHVCYLPTTHTGIHICWCDEAARPRSAA